MSASDYARTVVARSFSWTELISQAYAADPALVRAIRARPEMTETHSAGRRGDDIAALLLLAAAPPIACLLALLGAMNADAFGFYAVPGMLLLFANTGYILVGWRKSASRFHTRREALYAWSAAAFGVIGAVIAGVASAAGGESALNWGRPLAGVFVAVTVIDIAWAVAVRRRLRTMRDDQPVETSYAVLGAIQNMDAAQRAAAAADLRAAIAVLDERGIAAGDERPGIIGQLTRTSDGG